MGSIFRQLKKWKEAESHTLTSIEILKPLKSPQLLAQRYADLANLYEASGNTRKAKLWSNRAARMMEWEEQPLGVLPARSHIGFSNIQHETSSKNSLVNGVTIRKVYKS